MNGGAGRVPWMIVGISRSRASGWALAWAAGEGHRCGARLLLVRVFRPPAAPAVADYRYGVLSVPWDPYRDCMEHGYALIRRAIVQAVGWMAGDVLLPSGPLACPFRDSWRVPIQVISGPSN